MSQKSGSIGIFLNMKLKSKSSLHVTSILIHWEMFNSLVFSIYTSVVKLKATRFENLLYYLHLNKELPMDQCFWDTLYSYIVSTLYIISNIFIYFMYNIYRK